MHRLYLAVGPVRMRSRVSHARCLRSLPEQRRGIVQMEIDGLDSIRNLSAQSVIEFFRSQNYPGLAEKSLYSVILELLGSADLRAFQPFRQIGVEKLRTELVDFGADQDLKKLV